MPDDKQLKERLRQAADSLGESGFNDADVRQAADTIERLEAECERLAHGGEPDISPGDVIDAKPDGTIVLDDGITTWNPSRATAFLLARQRKSNAAVLDEVLKLQALIRLGLAEAQRNYSVSESGEPVNAYWDGKQKALGEVLGKLSTILNEPTEANNG